ncbi:peptidoglycan D,D-transpeptidase FtsI family protein [Virgibacillus ihumii]|uniref:peptidoglycan D,D-transpeptidase FtsI family protein n=1 Tax=Virgibacillus ihumii TaxID=2686091 RepID=UPI00157C6A20|nr:penicillin-binding protein 2 [Virgibacillus ihumii]
MVQRKTKKKKTQLPFRLNILFFIVFLLFSVLVLQLGVVQILNGEEFQEEIDKTVKENTEIPVPRGRMFDRNHNLIVGNKPLYSITYTPAKGVTAEDRLEVAEKLSRFISMPKENGEYDVTERNKKEYWYLKHTEEATSRLSDKELEKMDTSEEYNTILERIKKDEIDDFTEKQLEVMAIKKEMDQAMTLTPHVIKNENVTPEEFAKVSEHLDMLDGINATTDWDRFKPYGKTFSNFIGSITSQSQGILAEKEEYYLSRGYKRNDRVGQSGLEQQYESLLRGRKEKIQYTTNKDGKVIDSEVVVEGQRGKDLVLTINMKLQKKVNKILREELKAAIQKHPYKNRFMNDALAVVMNPQTGELLAVAGQHYNREKNEFENAGLKALYAAHEPGSAIKGATVLSGYESGVIDIGTTFYDAPIKIAGTPEKSSYRNLGLINDVNALKRSSNVYMFYIAMRMGGDFNYERNESLSFDPAAFQEIRNYFSQFGLGVSTGVDFPYESIGYEGPNPKAGNLLDFAIGQYDTYTTLQLAQYVSTIANDGYRVRPHFLKSVRTPIPHEEDLGPVYKSVNTQVLNKITMDDRYLERVQEGFRRVYQEVGGTAYSHFAGKSYNPAGKTGTAESDVYKDGEKVMDAENHTLVGYAPFNKPEVAFAVVVPQAGVVLNQHPTSKNIGERILDSYFELKEKNQSE